MKPLLVILPVLLAASGSTPVGSVPMNDPAYEPVKEKLVRQGVPPAFVDRTFASDRIAVEPGVVTRFQKPYEKKPYAVYRKLFLTPERVQRGARFYHRHETLFRSVERQYGVDPYLLLSIIGVESNFGEHHEDYSVFNALYTVVHEIPRKSDWAVQQLVEFLLYCYRDDQDPHALYGSYAGAFGYGQFIPSSFNHYAVDFNGNGKREPYNWDDTVASVANYLRQNGYRRGENLFSRQSSAGKAVWAYNHSENYVRAVLEFRQLLMDQINGK
ncbi:MAG: hypothetical protein D6762_01415 [Candidatus Neomarinimicrobiota bacterium]|nr:MAG: hypothetical protein D6762_01415 [Candidatus Neomarinimicrobiota bacterium]